jgi:hypothetical protein
MVTSTTDSMHPRLVYEYTGRSDTDEIAKRLWSAGPDASDCTDENISEVRIDGKSLWSRLNAASEE